MKIGIIGGSGLDNPEILENYKEEFVSTPYGKTSSSIICGRIENVEVCIIARHGRKHTITPTNVNNKANIYALARLGCKHIISTTAVGSLREQIKPGDLVILSDMIDFTRFRQVTFYNNFEKEIRHVSLAEPFSSKLRNILIDCAIELQLPFHNTGTVITVEGPRFSTKAESNLFRYWGADVINMSIAPEAILAKEADLEYAAIAMSTDYDCWKDDEEPVSWEMVQKRMKENADKVIKLIIKSLGKIKE